MQHSESDTEPEGQGSRSPHRSGYDSDPSGDSESVRVLEMPPVGLSARARAPNATSATSPTLVEASQYVPFRQFAQLRQTCEFMQGQNQELRTLVQSFSERVGLGAQVPVVGERPARDTAREVRAILAIAENWLRVLPSSSSGVRDPEG